MSSYVPVSSGGVRWKVLPDLRLLFEFGAFSNLEKLLRTTEVQRAEVVRDLRDTRLYEITVVDLIFYFKVYKPRGVLGRLFGGSGAERELENCLGAMRRGVQVVPLTAVGEKGAESFVVSQVLDGWTTLEESLLYEDVQGRPRRGMMFQFGVWARQIHDAGVLQPDIDPAHILVKTWGDEVEFRLMDFESMQLGKTIPEAKRMAAVARLNDFPKLTRTDRVRFLDGYVHKYPEESRAFKEMNEKVLKARTEQSERKTVRMALDCVQESERFGLFATEKHLGYFRRPRDANGAGIEVDEVVRISEGRCDRARWRIVESPHALYDWKQANVLVRDGGPTPLAVIVEAGRENGVVVYRA